MSTQITDAIRIHNLDGVNVDIENVTAPDRENYTKLVRLLREKLPNDKSIVVSVAANPYGFTEGWHASYDYTALAKYADYIMIMAYDESYEGGPVGPVASIGFVEESLKYALEKVSKDKVVLGIPFYGRYWKVGESSGGKALSLKQMSEILEKYENKVAYDNAKESPMARVIIKESEQKPKINGETLIAGTYEFWYENEESLKTKIELVEKYDIKGIGSWKLGLEESRIWRIVGNTLAEDNDESRFFKDVAEGHWAYQPIKNIKEKGLIYGKYDDCFAPEEFLTRGELATIVARIVEDENINLNVNYNNSINKKYEDIVQHWAKESIEKLTFYEIVEGYGNNMFRPDDNISRAEVAKIINKLLGMTGTTGVCNYIDVPKSHWSYENIVNLSDYGLINGYEDGSFRPDAYITRAEMAQIINELYKHLE